MTLGLGTAVASAAAAAALGGLLPSWRKRRRANAAVLRMLRNAAGARPASTSEDAWAQFLLARLEGEDGPLPRDRCEAPIRSFRDLVANPRVFRRACVVAARDEAFRHRM